MGQGLKKRWRRCPEMNLFFFLPDKQRRLYILCMGTFLGHTKSSPHSKEILEHASFFHIY